VDSRERFDRLAADFEAAHRTPLAEVDAEVLAQGLRARQRAAEVPELLDREGLTVAGSKGQPRQHPLLGEERGLREQ